MIPSLLISLFFGTSLVFADCSVKILPGLSDDKLTASSEKDMSYAPRYARLNSTEGSNWCALNKEPTEYIQVDMARVVTVGGVITQGRHSSERWVSKYKVRSSVDRTNWEYIKDKNGEAKIFDGNVDCCSLVTRMFEVPFEARYLRIYPHSWNHRPCLRFEVLSCNDQETTAEYPTTTVMSPPGEPTNSQMTSALSDNYGNNRTSLTTQEMTIVSDSRHTPTTTAPISGEQITTQVTPTLSGVSHLISSSSASQEPTGRPTSGTSYSAVENETTSRTESTSSAKAPSNCYMVCPKNFTEQELSEMVEQLKNRLKTERKKTNKYIRSKTSAPDKRKSAVAIGYVGIVILSVVGAGMLLLDVPNLIHLVQQLKDRIAQCLGK